MSTLPFSKWTLQFHNTGLATQYQEYIVSQKLNYFKLIQMASFLGYFVALLIFTIQQQEQILIIIISIIAFNNLLGMIFSQKFVPYFDLIFPSIYLAYYVTALLIAQDHDITLQYLHGYLNGIILFSLLKYQSIRLQPIFLCTNIIIMVGILGGFSLMNLNYISYAFGTNVIQIYIIYVNEYNQRMCFSQTIIINQQRKLMHDLISAKTIILSFDKKKQAFEQYFVNQKFEQIYKLENNQDKLNEFLRSHFIINLANHKIPISQRVLKSCNKQITLESYLYQKYETQMIDDGNAVQVEIIDQQNNENQIKILTQNGITKLFIITIGENNVKIGQEMYEKKIQRIELQQMKFSILIGKKLQTIYNQVCNFEINQNQIPTFNKIQGSLQFILNETKNQIMYFSLNKNQQIQQKIDIYQLSSFIFALQPYFDYQSQKFKKHFELILLFDQDNVQIKINTKLLTQLVINIINKIIYYSKSHSAIQLKISREFNLNPVYSIQQSQIKSSVSKYDYLCSSSESNQMLILFTFTFTTDNKIDNFESFFINQIKQSQTQGEDLICIVNSQILRQISPYNSIFISQEEICEQKIVKTMLTLYFYSDQTQIDQSYCQYFKKPDKSSEQELL